MKNRDVCSGLLLCAFFVASTGIAQPTVQFSPTGEATKSLQSDSRPSTAEPQPFSAESQPTCDGAASCEAGPLLAALLRLEAALQLPEGSERDISFGEAIQSIGALSDPRAVPLLVRLSHHPSVTLRLASLNALSMFTEDARARTRLQSALESSADPAESAVALPALLVWAARHPGEGAVPCPEEGMCADDAVLLDALLRYTESPTQEERAVSVATIAGLRDPRTIPMLLRLSADAETRVRLPAVRGLAAHAAEGRVQARLLALLANGQIEDRSAAVSALGPVDDEAVTEAFFAQRRIETDAPVRTALDAELMRRAPERLEVLREEERLAALAAENAPGAFDLGIRTLLSVGAGTSAAIGGAAASSVVADSINQGSGTCFGAWGACAGFASAAAIAWFALGDRKLGGADVALAASTGLAGGFAGLLIPPTIGPDATRDSRHMVYATSGGALVGIASGTVAALLTRPTLNDVAEYDLTVLGANALTAGALLSIFDSTDPRPLYGSLIGATLLGSAAGGAAGYFLSLDPSALVHAGLLVSYGLGAGLLAGGARAAFERQFNPSHITGGGLLGSALGVAAGLTLGQLKLVPSVTGMIYEGWASLAYGAFGAGTGLFIGRLTGREAEFGLVGATAGAVLGVGSTALFSDGVAQDYGDLMLQPLFVGFGLYHAAVLTGFATQDAGYTGAAVLLAPSLASAGLVYAAPFIRAGTGDVLMVASLMGLGAYLSAMGMVSVAMRAPNAIPGWGYVLGTSLAMDVGLLAGVGLDLLDIDQLGWRTTYIAAVAAGTTLVLSLPGALFASRPDSPVKVPDVLLAATLLGTAIGFATMPFVDFRIAPDFGLGKRPSNGPDVGNSAHLQIVPMVATFAPLRGHDAPVGFGLAGRF